MPIRQPGPPIKQTEALCSILVKIDLGQERLFVVVIVVVLNRTGAIDSKVNARLK